MKNLLLAVAPVLVIIIYIYCKDKYEKEPRGLLFLRNKAGVYLLGSSGKTGPIIVSSSTLNMLCAGI